MLEFFKNINRESLDYGLFVFISTNYHVLIVFKQYKAIFIGSHFYNLQLNNWDIRIDCCFVIEYISEYTCVYLTEIIPLLYLYVIYVVSIFKLSFSL